MNLGFLSKRMFRRNDDDQILLGNRNKFDQWFVVKFGTEADIVFLLFQSGEDIAGKNLITEQIETSVYKGYKQDKIEMRGDRAEMSDFPLYLNTVAGGLDRRDQTIGGFSFVVKIYAVPVVEIIG